MKGLRSFLERNKIYFETLAAVSLSVMAIIISVAEVTIAARQNELVELQAQIERQQLLPQIQIDLENIHVRDSSSGEAYLYEEKATVNNFGGVARSPHAQTVVFLDVQLTPVGTSESITKSFPLIGYFYLTTTFNDGVGKLLEIRGPENWSKRVQLEKGFDELIEQEGYIAGDLEFRKYLKLTYQDIFGDAHIDYFLLEPNAGGLLLQEAEAELYFSQANPPGSLELFQLSPQALFDMTLAAP